MAVKTKFTEPEVAALFGLKPVTLRAIRLRDPDATVTLTDPGIDPGISDDGDNREVPLWPEKVGGPQRGMYVYDRRDIARLGTHLTTTGVITAEALGKALAALTTTKGA